MRRIRELEAQVQAVEEGVLTSPSRGEELRTSTPAPVVERRQPTHPTPFHKVSLPTYDGMDPSLYRDFNRRICTMLMRDVTASDNDHKYHLGISLMGYASDLVKEVVDSPEYEEMSFQEVRSTFFNLLSDSSNASTDGCCSRT